MTKNLLLTLLVLLAPMAVQAAAVDLYVGEVPVADQGPADRERALPQALRQVLQKLSGLRGFDEYPLVEPALERAPTMLLTWHYRNVPVPLADGSETSELRLVARFAPAAVDEMARSLQLPQWQPERPELLAWLIVDDGVDRRIMPVEFAYVRESMADAAALRGLPLKWPQPGPEGEWNVDPQILWGGYTEDLETPQNEGVMIAAARREGLQWGVRVNLGYRGQYWAWRVEDFDLQVAMNTALHDAVDQVAAANTIAANDLGSWEQTLTVTGLRGAADYQRCLAYLQGISVVEGVDVVSAQPGVVTFRLALNALPRYLEESLGKGGVLEWQASESRYRLLEAARHDG
ncbi:MAG: DUF2066 domain-containing protein [Xanthomonadales bacterium]|nr:DUF2066 domain-containing protein [Xanthomonadales bacterium]